MSIVTNKTAFYKKTSCKICVISVPKLTFDIFYLLEAGVFEMDNNLWIIISSERKWNLKHDERFFLFSALMLPLDSVCCELAGESSIILQENKLKTNIWLQLSCTL